MPSIFADKELLKQEYIKLFREILSDIDRVCGAIKSRYGKDIDMETLNGIASDAAALEQFIELKNKNRIKLFFGKDPQTPKMLFDSVLTIDDSRDEKTNTFDHFVLDAINWEIWATFMHRFPQEYETNQVAIDKAWEAELIEFRKGENDIPASAMFYGTLSFYRSVIFKDLKFNEIEKGPLFSLRKQDGKSELVVLYASFANWLKSGVNVELTSPKKSKKLSNLGYYGIIAEFMIVGAIALGNIGLVAGPVGIIVGAAIGLVVGLIAAMIAIPILEKKLAVDTEDKMVDSLSPSAAEEEGNDPAVSPSLGLLGGKALASKNGPAPSHSAKDVPDAPDPFITPAVKPIVDEAAEQSLQKKFQ